MTVGDRIREIRGYMSQRDFAQKLGISQSSISGYEKNTRSPDYDIIRKICSEFNVSADWIILGKQTAERNENYALLEKNYIQLSVKYKQLDNFVFQLRCSLVELKLRTFKS